MIVKKGKFDELYADLLATDRLKEVQEHEITSKLYAEKTGLGRRWAAEKLEKLVRSGILARREARAGDKRVIAYSRISDER